MKKHLSTVLVVLLAVLSLCACNTQGGISPDTTLSQDGIISSQNTEEESTAVSPTAYKGDNPEAPDAETVVKAFMDNIDKWNNVPEYCNWNGYLFLDLNFDGILELIVTSNSGTGQFSDNFYYIYDDKTNSVSELPFHEKDEEYQSDFFFTDYPKLYKNNKTGEKTYLLRDHLSGGNSMYTEIYETLCVDSSANIVATKLWSTEFIAAEFSDSGADEYTYRLFDEKGESAKVDKETYDNTVAEFENTYTELNLHYEIVQGNDFSEADADTQQALLLASYKAFYY